MLLRIALFLVMALGLAGFGTVAWLGTRPPPTIMSAAPQTDPPPLRSMVLAASHSLRAGTLLRPEDITAIEVPPADIPRGARRDTPVGRTELLGAMLRHTLSAEEIMLPGDIVRTGDRGFLAAVLAPGRRAITIGVDAVSGTAGLIWPGDHVDVILTQAIEDTTAAPGRRVSGETVMHDIRVIAIDQDLTQGATRDTVPGVAPGTVVTAANRTVTLEASPDQAERVAVATRLGHLSLSVIAAEDAAPDAAPARAAAITWGGDVSPALQAGHAAGTNTIRVFLGKDDGKDFHF